VSRRGDAALLRAGRRAGRALGRAALSERGRWAGRVAGLTVAVAVVVVLLYAHGDAPATARPAGPPPAHPARTARPPARAQARPAAPAEVAAAWYAARRHLPHGQVRALQQDRRSAREVRVLVLAQPGHGGRLDTALVTVRRGPRGWVVP
jgi:hypothetical protein